MYSAHGGNLDYIERRYNIPKDEIIDFSGNINPLGAPESVIRAIGENMPSISTYPDIDYVELRESIARYTGALTEQIIVGNGSTELISLLIKTLRPEKAVIVSPAYSEYEREIKLMGGSCEYFSLTEEEDFQLNTEHLLGTLNESIGLLVLCNPNNPTGCAVDNGTLAGILSHCEKNHIFVLIDETYVEFSEAPDISSVELASQFHNFITVRGVSKFFAAPGLRLGYAICSNPDILSEMNKLKDPWSVNILAVFGGCAMFGDDGFINATKNLIFTERKKFFNELKHWDFVKTYPSQANFILVKILDDSKTAGMVFEKLISHKLLIRDCSNYLFLGEKFLRFCILLPEHNALLLKHLKEGLM